MNETNSPEFVISRTFEACRDLVWKAFTDAECMKEWWGPKGTKIISSKMDCRPGGTYLYGMSTADGHEVWGKYVYREITAPEKVILINSFSDAQGGLSRHPMSATWPLEMLSTFTFEEKAGQTTLTIIWVPFNATEEESQTFANALEGCKQGWAGTLDQLEEYLKTKC